MKGSVFLENCQMIFKEICEQSTFSNAASIKHNIKKLFSNALNAVM